jgi:hypothetical protein
MPRTKWTGEWEQNYSFQWEANKPYLDETTYKRLKKLRYDKENCIPNWVVSSKKRKMKGDPSYSTYINNANAHGRCEFFHTKTYCAVSNSPRHADQMNNNTDMETMGDDDQPAGAYITPTQVLALPAAAQDGGK